MAGIRFERIRGLIVLRLEIGSIDGSASGILPVALDTGASNTTVPPELVTALGYDLSKSGHEVSVVTGNGDVPAKCITVRKLTAIGETVENIDVLCHNLSENSVVGGVLGMNFLEHFDVNISFSTGTIELRRHNMLPR